MAATTNTSNGSTPQGSAHPGDLHQSALWGDKTFHGLTILATSEEPGFKNIIRVKTSHGEVKYIINVTGALQPGFQYKANDHLLDDLPPIGPSKDKFYWLERHAGKVSSFRLRTEGTPAVCDGVENVRHPVMTFRDDVVIVDHPVLVEYHELTNDPTLVDHHVQYNNPYFTERVGTVIHPQFPGKMVMRIVAFPECLYNHPLTKMEPHELRSLPDTPLVSSTGQFHETATQRMEREIKVYQLAAAHGLAPKFVGLVTEQGRGVIGYLSEFIEDAQPLWYAAEEHWTSVESARSDMNRCVQVLKSLHTLGIVHGDVHGFNFIRRADKSILLVDFEEAYVADQVGAQDNAFDVELARLERLLNYLLEDRLE